MMGRLDRWFFERVPAERLAVFRCLLASLSLAYLLVRGPAILRLAGRAIGFRPVGPVAMLAAPMPSWALVVLYVVTVLAGAAVVVGLRHRITAPAYALGSLWLYSYRSSFGMVFHTENLMVLHLLVLAVAPAADALSLDARRRARQGQPPAPADGRHGWPLRLMMILAVVTYLLAGIAKLRNAGWEWASGDVLRVHVAYDNLRKIEMGDWYSPLGAALVPHGWVFPPLAWASLLLELGAPLALLHRAAGRIWALAIWAFHVGVLALMAILFLYPVSFVALAPFFPLEQVLTWRWVRRVFRGALPAS